MKKRSMKYCAESLLTILVLIAWVDSQTIYYCGIPTNPQGNTLWPNWQTYYSTWNDQYSSYAYKGMYPFGTTYCDQNATGANKTNGFNAGITFPFNFYGSIYRSFVIAPYGYIILNETAYQPSASFNYLAVKWPNQNYPLNYAIDPPLIAPLYASYYYPALGSYDPSQISWRVLNPQGETNATLQGIQQGMLNQLTKDVRAAALGTMWFTAQWGLIVTYYNVTAATQPSCTAQQNGPDNCLRNTFQVALVTDGTNSFAIYNYFNISWIAGTDYQGCDPTSFNATNYPNCVPSQMGFNSGFARGFTSLPYAGTQQMIDMDSLSGSNVTGRWVYRVSGDVVHHGGCTNDTSLGSAGTWPLVISPLFGPMFGGNVVNVSGPCFLKGANIKCRFGTVVTNAYNWGDMMQVMCVQPMLYEVGPVNLSVSIDGGQNYYFSTIYTVLQQEKVPELGVRVTNANNNWLKPTTMTLDWNYANLTTEWGNAVTIQLMGYYQKTWQVIYTFKYELAQNPGSNPGTFSFTYNPNMCYTQNNHKICSKYALGSFRVSLSNWQWDYQNPIALWSPPVPLAWFMEEQVSSNEGSGWSHDNCRNWYNSNTMITNRLPPCPCTLNQSYVDMSFYPTADCNLNNNSPPSGCPRNQGAVACYESVNISSSGSSTRCCYNRYGNLLYSGDSVNGSISQRSDPSGLYPYNNNPFIPSISTWENDLLPYYYCCIWQNNPYDCFNIYMVSRPTQDCKSYTPPGHATAYGDPHFITMDGTAYAFNGWGEYWLLQITNAQVAGGSVSFSLQGRFQQPSNKTWVVQATVMTAAAMQVNGGTVVTVMSNQWGTVERLLVYVNSTLLNFTSNSQYWQQFPDFFVVNNDMSGANSNFSVLFRMGIGINIAWKTGVMELFATIPAEFKGITGGLFGYWNGNPQDDLMPSGSGSTPVSATNAQSVYTYGQSWMVQPTQTIFTYVYRASMNYNYYKNQWFTPWLNLTTIPPGVPVTPNEVTSVCFSDQACQYDYQVSGNVTVAQDTYAITMWDAQIRQMGANQLSCGWLPVADSTKNEPVSYMVGSQVTITGCFSGFMEENGNIKTFTCQQSGTTAVWSSTPYIYCSYLNGQPPPSVQAAIAVPICVVCTLGIVLLIIFLCRYKKRKARREGRKENRAERHEAKHLDAIPPEPMVEEHRQEVVDGVSLTKTPYNNIVTGGLSDSYLERASRSSTPSKMSVETGVSNVPLAAPPRSRTPSQRYPYNDGSRTATPTQGVSKTISYSTNPGQGQAELTLTVKAQTPGPVPYQYQAGRQSPYQPNGGENYFNRRYAPSPASLHGNDSEV